jgi:hypothetical protein
VPHEEEAHEAAAGACSWTSENTEIKKRIFDKIARR